MNLQLPLKKVWFEKTKSGEKKEDYRELTLYWFKRLVFNPEKVIKYLDIKTNLDIENVCKDPKKATYIGFKPFVTNTMTLGYPKKTASENILVLDHKGIEINYGVEKWGATPGKLYFVIKHQDRNDYCPYRDPEKCIKPSSCNAFGCNKQM